MTCSSVKYERLTTNQKAGGSNPSGRTPYFPSKSTTYNIFVRSVKLCQINQFYANFSPILLPGLLPEKF